MKAYDSRATQATSNVSDELLLQAVKEYQSAFDEGETPDRAEFISRFPEIKTELSACLDNMDFLRNVAPQLNDATEASDGTPQIITAPPQLGDFRILREIGRGGMGVVYEAEQISMSRRVALKVLPFAAILDQKALQRFRSEAQVAGQLVHQNIVPVYSVGCERSVHYYAMQHIEGQTLAELIATLRVATGTNKAETKNKVLPEGSQKTGGESCAPKKGAYGDTSSIAGLATAKSHRESSYIGSVVKLFIQAAEALDYAHGEGVIHRDVKPSNLMLDGRGKIFVTDFGLAHVEAGPSVTITGDFLGTLRYMSPEQAMAQRVVVDHRTDIYSLGLTFYEMLALRPAFTGNDRQELLRQITFDEPPRPRRINDAIPPDLETILLKSIEKNPADRYASAGELAGDLRRYVEDRPIQAKRPTPLQKTRKWCRRHRSLVTTSIVATVLLLAIVAIGSSLLAVRLREVAKQEKAAVKKQLEDKERIAALLASSYHDQGHLLCAKGEIAPGMLWMAHALHVAPGKADQIRRVIRQDLAAWSTQLHQLKAVFRHDRPVMAVTHCPETGRVFTGHDDGSGQLWNRSTGESIGPAIQLNGPVTAAAFHPGNNLVAAGSAQGALEFINASTGRSVGTTIEVGSDVRSLAFNRDGSQLLVGTSQEAILMAVPEGQTLARSTAPTEGVADVSFGPEGTPLALMESLEAYQLWDLAAQKSLGGQVSKSGRNQAAIAPAGRHFAAGGGANWLWYWDALSGEQVFPDKQHGSDIYAVAISSDGRKLASAGLNSAVRIWDAVDGQNFGHALDHTGPIMSPAIQFSSNGKNVLAGAEDGTTRMWELAADSPATFPASGGVAFEPDGWRVAASAGTDSHVEIWDLNGTSLEGPQVSLGSNIDRTEFTSDGKSIVTVTREGLVEVRNALSGEIVGEPFHAGTIIRDIKLSPDGSRLLAAYQAGQGEGHALVWDLGTGSRIGSPLNHDQTVVCVDISRDGRKMATGGFDGTVRVWDAATLAALGDPLRHENHVTGVAFSPDGKRLAVATAGRTGHIWDLLTHSRIGQPLQHKVGLRAIAYSPDSDRPLVLTGALDNTAQFWDANTGKPIGPALPHEGGVWQADFSPDGSMVFVAGDGTARIWPVPPPAVDGVLERIDLWAELITGMTLDMNAGGAVKTLSATDWLSRRKRLQQLGGPPL